MQRHYSALRPFVIISFSYLLFTTTDGAVRMIVLLHAYKSGFSAWQVREAGRQGGQQAGRRGGRQGGRQGGRRGGRAATLPRLAHLAQGLRYAVRSC